VIRPDFQYRVLLQTASQLAEGYGVAIMPHSQELTTQQAADLLNVSRPHVVTCLDAGAMPFHHVGTLGTHRRVYLKDLLEYKHHRDAARRHELQATVDEAQELGVYDK
jgi:excisionase family DNA binding protein